MPQRIVKESLNSHPVLEQLTPEEEVCFRRLMTACDDFGRFSGDLDLIVGECFPKRRRTMDDTALEGWLQGLQSKGAILLYESGEQRYLQMLVWDEKPRAKASKFPAPPTGSEDSPPPTAPKDEGPGPGPGPRGGTDAPTNVEAPPPAAVPSDPSAGQNAVSGQGDPGVEAEARVPEVDQELTDAVRQLARCHEAHCVRTLNDTDADILRNVVLDARDAGVPWQTLLTIMRDKQAEYLRDRKTRTKPTIDRVGYYVAAWDTHIKAAKAEAERVKPATPGGQRGFTPTAPVSGDDQPPLDDDDEISLRIREQTNTQLRRGTNGHAATA